MENHFLGHKQAVYSIQSNGFGGWYSAGSDGWIVHWPDCHKSEGILLAQIGEPIYSLFVCGLNHEFILAGGQSGTVYAFQLENTLINNSQKADLIGSNHSETENVETATIKIVQLWSQRFHSKGVFDFNLLTNNWLASCSADGTVAVWNLDHPETGGLESNSIGGSLRCFCAAHFNNLRIDNSEKTSNPVADIFVGGFLGKVYQFRLYYSLETGEPSRLEWLNSETKTLGVNTLFQCVSFNGQFITAGRDAKIWFTDSRFQIVKKIDAHWFSIHALAISPEEKFLASGSMDKSIRIWDLKTGELLFHKELAHRSSVNKIIWLSENRIVSCSDDAQIISWKIEN